MTSENLPPWEIPGLICHSYQFVTNPVIGQVVECKDADGRAAWGSGGGGGSGTVTEIKTGTGLEGGPITTTGTISMANTTVVPGAYTNANITVDAQGRITSAANGSGGGSGTVTSITAGIGLNGGTITTSGTIDLANTTVAPGAYTNANITVDAQGRLTSAVSGLVSPSVGPLPILTYYSNAPQIIPSGADTSIIWQNLDNNNSLGDTEIQFNGTDTFTNNSLNANVYNITGYTTWSPGFGTGVRVICIAKNGNLVNRISYMNTISNNDYPVILFSGNIKLEPGENFVVYVWQNSGFAINIHTQPVPGSSIQIVKMQGSSSTNVYGEIYSTTLTQSFNATPSPLTGFTAGLCAGITPGTDRLTVGATGIYQVLVTFDGSINSNNKNVTIQVYKNGIAEPKLTGSAHYQNSNTDVSTTIDGFIQINAGEYLSLYINNNGGNLTFTAHKISMTLVRLA